MGRSVELLAPSSMKVLGNTCVQNGLRSPRSAWKLLADLVLFYANFLGSHRRKANASFSFNLVSERAFHPICRKVRHFFRNCQTFSRIFFLIVLSRTGFTRFTSGI